MAMIHRKMVVALPADQQWAQCCEVQSLKYFVVFLCYFGEVVWMFFSGCTFITLVFFRCVLFFLRNSISVFSNSATSLTNCCIEFICIFTSSGIPRHCCSNEL